MFLFVYAVLFAFGERIWTGYHIFAGITMVFLGLFIFTLTSSIPLGILINALGALTIIMGIEGAIRRTG